MSWPHQEQKGTTVTTRDYTIADILELLKTHGWKEIEHEQEDERSYWRLQYELDPSRIVSISGKPDDYPSPTALASILRQME